MYIRGTTTCCVSCSCNRTPHCIDWGENGLICFGTCNAIAIYKPLASSQTCIGGINHMLHRHRDHVTTVQWIRPRNNQPEQELVSGSADGNVIIWSMDEYEVTFQITLIMNVGSKVTFVDSLQLSTDVFSSEFIPELLICIGTIDGKLILRSRSEYGHTTIEQVISLEGKLPIYCRLAHLPDTKHFLLAVALEDASVLLYTGNSCVSQLNLVKVQILFGHKDWVTCMDFNYDDYGNVFLATGSQDHMIRLWKISESQKPLSDELSVKRHIFLVNNREYDITLESVLCGHEGWIYGVHWQTMRLEQQITGEHQRIQKLLSCSIDKSMIIWRFDDITKMWLEEIRVGNVGGSSSGFYGCKFSPDGKRILAYDYQGSFHIWQYDFISNKWISQSMSGGHFSEVNDLCWDPSGRFLITASADQTTRIYTQYKNLRERDVKVEKLHYKETWHEIARPQIHGYNMTCLVMLEPYMYASGAEEKVVRVFTATAKFTSRLEETEESVQDFKFVTADNAAVPSLGLTNKATFDEKIDQCESEKKYSISEIFRTPTEEELELSRWPEFQKLYGHGYDIFCMAARHDGKLLATACKSTNREHAAIILWSTDTWSEVQKLVSHHLTVTQMEFSLPGKYLLSVSRDRRWSLFKKEDNISIGDRYTLFAVSSKNDSLHSRIIWCCSWASDSRYFATGSRDGKVGIWSISTIERNTESPTPEAFIDTESKSVTALAFKLSIPEERRYALAIGYENGRIEIRMMTELQGKVTLVLSNCVLHAHHLTVKRLQFRPSTTFHYKLQLASCSSDRSVKLHYI